MDAVALRRVSFGHGGHQAVSDLDLTVTTGEVLALVGTSGAGKTTVLRLINRLVLPDSGDVLVEGRTTREWNPIALRRRIGYVIQEVGLFPHMTVGDNVAVVPRLERWDAARIERRVRELLDLVELPSSFSDRFPDELSGGQRQRVGVARALAADPPILLMDEPFGALDALTRRQLQEAFLRIQEQLRKSVVIVTHDMGEAVTLADRIAVMDGGRLCWSGEAQALSASNDALVQRLVDAATPRMRTGTDRQ